MMAFSNRRTLDRAFSAIDGLRTRALAVSVTVYRSVIHVTAIAAAAIVLVMAVMIMCPGRSAAAVTALNFQGAACQIQIATRPGQIPQLLAPHAAVMLEVAKTPDERRHGLMDRTSLERHHGMIFLFANDALQRFWMKDTLIPLDMVFAQADGKITKVIADAAPGGNVEDFELPVYSGVGCAVIELPAGEAALDGLTVGQRLRFRGSP
jgi:uncharacterized membrane protein (UPF0127 family)